MKNFQNVQVKQAGWLQVDRIKEVTVWINFIISIGIVLLVVLVIFGAVHYQKRKQNYQEDKKHSILLKDSNLKELIGATIKNENSLYQEFANLNEAVEEQVNETFNVARNEDNLAHNRFKDIGK